MWGERISRSERARGNWQGGREGRKAKKMWALHWSGHSFAGEHSQLLSHTRQTRRGQMEPDGDGTTDGERVRDHLPHLSRPCLSLIKVCITET